MAYSDKWIKKIIWDVKWQDKSNVIEVFDGEHQ